MCRDGVNPAAGSGSDLISGSLVALTVESTLLQIQLRIGCKYDINGIIKGI